MIKKYIRGNKERGAEVIKALKNLGGVNKGNLKGDDPNCVYIININSVITRWHYDTEYAFMIQECFEEIKLEDKKVITNIDVVEWYDTMIRKDHSIQFMNARNYIYTAPWCYVDDDGETEFIKVRIDFGEWIPIEEAGID